jgi:sugar lactone lactonase YvrE
LLGQAIPITQSNSTFSLGATNLLEGPAAGSDSVVLAVSPNFGTWTAASNATWLHLNQSGTGSMNVIFTFDANPGATRSNTLTIAGQTLTVTQAGSTYVAAQPLATLVSNLDEPYGVAVDSRGNVFIADSGYPAIMEWTPASDTLTNLVSSGLSNPRGVAVDGADNLYISDYANNAIYEWPAASHTLTNLVSSQLFNPFGLAVDGADNIYIADYGGLAIKEYSVAESNLTTLVSSELLFPSGVAVDVAGNVYITDTGNNVVKKWTAANSNVTVLVSGLAGPSGVAVDGSGNIYIADTGNHAVKKWTAASGNVTTLVSNLAGPSGVAVDGSGNVYIADTAGNAIDELPYAFVDTSPRFENNSAGSDQLPTVLPAAANLSGPFTPASSDTDWLTINLPVANGEVSFSFAANTNPATNRIAYINLLNQAISITQGTVPFTNATSLVIGNLRLLGNGVLQFTFTNNPNATFTVLSTTNLALPLADWTTVLTTNGAFQFTSQPATNDMQLFYVVRSP